jgi:hypothetical protein
VLAGSATPHHTFVILSQAKDLLFGDDGKKQVLRRKERSSE